MDGANEIDTLKVEDEPKSAAGILSAIKRAEQHYNGYQALCDTIADL